MQPFPYAKALLQHWSITVEDIPTGDAEKKQEADFLATDYPIPHQWHASRRQVPGSGRPLPSAGRLAPAPAHDVH